MDTLFLNIVICSVFEVLITVILPEGQTRELCGIVVGLSLFYCIISWVIGFIKNLTILSIFGVKLLKCQ